MSDALRAAGRPPKDTPAPIRRKLVDRGGALGLSKVVWTLVVALLGFLGLGRFESRKENPPIRAAALPPGDTTFHFGPVQREGASGAGNTYVDQITIPLEAGRIYHLRVQNGTAGGANRVSSAATSWNGAPIIASSDLGSGTYEIERVVAATAVDTLEMTVKGPSGSYVTVAVYSLTTGEPRIFGENTYSIISGSGASYTPSFTKPSGTVAPYRLYVLNGDSAGNNRVTSAEVKLNDVVVFSPSEFSQTVGSLVKEVTVTAGTNSLDITLNGSAGRRIRLLVTARDTTSPALTITAPAESTVTTLTALPVAGTASSATAVTVTVNGVAATVAGDSTYSGSATLVEGWNTITVVATNPAGSTTQVRHVRRDTQAPALTVAAPSESTFTRNPTVTVSGTVTDAGSVTVNTNGTPLTVVGTSFSGAVPLTYGGNILVTTATDQASNQTVVPRNVFRDTLAPTLAVSAPADGSTTTADSITVSGTVSDASPVTVTVNGLSAPVTSGGYSRKVPLSVGSNTITTVAADAATNSRTDNRTVTRGQGLPPDPATVAPPLSPSVATTVYSASSFLYTGGDPIQTGVAPGAITLQRAAVVRGKVVDTAGAALSGAVVTIVGKPELGQTLSRADGRFDLAVNGGGRLLLQAAKPGFLPVQRSLDVPWQDWVVVDSVSLTPLSARSTQISFAAPIEVARGDSVSDSSGVRQARMMFRQGTQVSVTLPGGGAQNLSGPIRVRATEYTVGPMGPARMPGDLPSTSAYTYAAELSVDQADSLGATSVQFSQPVSFYLDGFIAVPVGYAIPIGTYDRQQGKWNPETDGRVIKILGVTDGKADLQVDTVTNHIAPQAQLDSLGITDAERTQLAGEYAAGKVLWRSQHTHFSPGDWNLIFSVDSGARAPRTWRSSFRDLIDKSCKRPGSVIGCENQTLGEAVPITGTPFALHYQSERTRGYTAESVLDLQINEDTLPGAMAGSRLRFTVAGKLHQEVYGRTPGLRDTLVWDGLDAYDRPAQGRQIATLQRCYLYPVISVASIGGTGSGGGSSFGRRAGLALSGGETLVLDNRSVYTHSRLCSTIKLPFGAWSNPGQGLGGWTLSAAHAYDPQTQTLYLGDGERREAKPLGNIIRTAAGVGDTGYTGDGGPARVAKLSAPEGVAAGPRGDFYFTNAGRPRLSRVDSAGIITTVAGNGTLCPLGTVPACGDGGPATAARFRIPTDVAIGPDGALYVADRGDARVRRVAPDGTISTFAGTGTAGYSGNGGPATAAQISQPNGVAVGPDGSVYIADGARPSIRRVSPVGIISTIAGTGTIAFFGGDGKAATSVGLGAPQKVVVGPDGSVYFSDSYHRRVRRIAPNGIITTVAGNGVSCNAAFFSTCGDNGKATQAAITGSSGGLDLGLALGPDGSLYIAATELYRIRRVDPNGIITTIAGTGEKACSVGTSPVGCVTPNGDGGIPLQAALHGTLGLAVGPEGTIYLADRTGNRIRTIAPALPGLQPTDMLIASEDGGALYRFNSAGRHLDTRDPLTGATLLTLAYDSAGQLTTLTDANSNVTTIERTNGLPTAIVAPFGQRTTLTTDGNGNLSQISNPGGERVRLFVRANGLLDSLADPRGQVHTFTYDNLGRLTRDTDPAGGFSNLVVDQKDTTRQVTLSTAMGRTTTYRVKPFANGDLQRVVTDPASLVTKSLVGFGGTTTTTSPDSTVITSVQGADPRFGMQAPVLKSLSVKLPSGLTSTVTGIRRDSLTNPLDPLSLVSQTDSVSLNGKWTRSVYTAATRRLVQTSPVGRQLFSTLDTLGRVISTQVVGLDSVRFVYDSRGRLSQEIDGGRVTRYGYNAASGRLDSIVDPLSRLTRFTYDSAGRVKTQILPDGRVIAFAYDSNGNLTSLSPPGRPAHGFQYQAADLAKQYDPPLLSGAAKPTKYFYNLDRQVDSIVRPDSLAIKFKYDNAGRPDTVHFDRGYLRFGYSATTGNLTSIRAPGNDSLKFSYDGSLPTQVTWAGSVAGSVRVKYNSDFRVDSQFVNGANGVRFAYDNDGLLTQAGALKLGRSATNGLLTADTLGPVRTGYSYTSRGELRGYQVTRSSTVLFGVGYVRDSLGRITQLFDTTQGTPTRWSYVYDGMGRLVADSVNGSIFHAFTYDSNGNRLSYISGGGTVNYTYDNQDRLLTAGSISYSYTSNGELTRKIAGSDTTRYTYDVLGNLVKVILPTRDSIEYLIDGQNRRVGRKLNGVVTHRWLYQNQLNPVAELDSAGNVVSRFVYGSRLNVPDYMVKGGSVYRLIADHLGSVRLVVDTATGTVAQWAKYDEWGVVTADSGAGFQPFGFAGGMGDAPIGFVRFGARDYDPSIARWTAKDPAGFAGGIGLYSFVGNDPINRIDPSGLWWLTPQDGQNALDYYKALIADPCASALTKGAAYVGAFFSALWTPDTWKKTAITLTGAYFAGTWITDVLAVERVVENAPNRWPGNDPTQAPPGTQWRGKPGSTPGDGQGNYYNPATTEYYRPDFNHPPPIRPHWDYRAPDGSEWRIFPDGTMQPKL